MSLIFDGVILVVCILAIVLGAVRGFIKSVMGVLTLITALVAAYAFSPIVADRIEETKIITNITESITDTLKSLTENERGTYDTNRLFEDMPDAFRQIIDRYDADEKVLEQTVGRDTDAEEEMVGILSDMIARPVARTISNVIAFLAVFLAAVIVLKLLTWILDLIFRLPVLKTANTMLGLMFGIAAALLWAWTLSTLSVTLIRAMSSISPEMFSESIIDNSIIVRFFSGGAFADLLNTVTHWR